MSGGGGGSRETIRETTQTASTEPPGFQKPFLQRAFGEAENLFERGLTPIGFAPETQEALGNITSLARAGSPLTAGATDLTQRTLGGEFTQAGNPFLDRVIGAASRPVVQQFTDEILPAIDATFVRAGRGGSGLQGQTRGLALDTLGRTLGDISSNIGFQSFEAERGRQQEAAKFAPLLAQQRFADAERLAQVGGAREAAIQEARDVDFENLLRFFGIVGGNFGGTTTSTGRNVTAQPTFGGGGLGGALGAGLLLASLF